MDEMARLCAFVDEDAPTGDITSASVVPDIRCRAVIVAKTAAVAAGLSEASSLFAQYGVTAAPVVADGDEVHAGQVLMDLQGPARAVLLVERTALNIISRMSGIATQTRRIVTILRASGSGARLAATRKTAPGLRWLDKKAVVLGGGDPHRQSLSDQVLIKDNHLALVPLAEAVRRARSTGGGLRIEVEVTSAAGAVEAALNGADIILLDNMTPQEAGAAIRCLKDEGLRERVAIEVSGGITAENIAGYAGLDIDVISMGALTHSVTATDVSLEITGPIQ